MIKCSVCPTVLTGGLDTFGSIDLPLCQECYWRDIDIQKEKEQKAKQERQQEEQRLRNALQEAQADLEEFEIGGDYGDIREAKSIINKIQYQIREIEKR